MKVEYESNRFVYALLVFCCLFIRSTSFSSDDVERHPSDVFNLPSNGNRIIGDLKHKVDRLGTVLKNHIQRLRATENKKVDIIFLVDSSSSVGGNNFQDELKFVKKLLSDFTVDPNHTRVAVVTFSSKGRIVRQVDYIAGQDSDQKQKCSLLEEDIPKIRYRGGGTYTYGAVMEAKAILRESRAGTNKAVFLITDGFSNIRDPAPAAQELKDLGVKMFTFGIRNGNVKELMDMASEPKNETCYILETFEEFEALARRALHEDLSRGYFLQQPDDKCRHLCPEESDCCDVSAKCSCGTHVGKYECVCMAGMYGQGLHGHCTPCPSGTYKREAQPGDVTSCTPCPDPNHVTPLGATDVSQCTCKTGYRRFNESGCVVLTCPILSPPEHGYFVNNKCNNVFNAACGIKCNHGYERRGNNSLSICQEDGTWSGETPKCVMKTCPALPRPKNGYMVCDSEDFSFSTQCRFTCDTGYKLVGSVKRECLAVALWTGIPTRCREITCPPLPEVKDGTVNPASCTTKEVKFGTTCEMSCLHSYALIGSARKQCTPEGVWAPDTNGTMSRCEDTTPPFLTCPSDVIQLADEFEGDAVIDWAIPLAIDNSGLLPSLKTIPSIDPPRRFPIGKTMVKYSAEDHSGNVAKCTFNVVVKDETPPRVDRCFPPMPFVSSSEYSRVTWEEPLFSDNSGGNLRVERSHEPGLFPQGKTVVTYTVWDSSGNNNTCQIDIKVIPHPCQYPTIPSNGQRNCYEDEMGLHCRVSCDEGFMFAVTPAEEYLCEFDGIWKPEDRMPIPDCTVIEMSNIISQPASLSMVGDFQCTDHILLDRFQETFTEKLSLEISNLCAVGLRCFIDEVHITCQGREDIHHEDIILGRSKRHLWGILHRYKRDVIPNAEGTDDWMSKLTFNFSIKSEISDPVAVLTSVLDVEEDEEVNKRNFTTVQLMAQEKLVQTVSNVVETLKTQANSGNLNVDVEGVALKVKAANVTNEKPVFNCDKGSIRVDTACVKCPPGNLFNVLTEECESCPTGTYQTLEGQVTCSSCPIKSSTLHNSSKTQDECRDLCLPGSYSDTGLEKCVTCLKGSYQDQYGQTTCLPCPEGTTTIRRGAMEPDKCRRICLEGHVSKTGVEPCYPCPRGSYQPEQGKSSCFRCPLESPTPERGSTSLNDCEGYDEVQADAPSDLQAQEPIIANECFNVTCQNGGSCQPNDVGFVCACPDKFQGNFCETLKNACEGEPCMNSGTCQDLHIEFKCDCEEGFTGKKCEININECETALCNANSTCVDGVNTYTCLCPTGFTGDLCDTLVDDCVDRPCQNGGRCENVQNGYICHCETGYTGVDCETNIDECRSAPCLNDGQCVDLINGFQCICAPGFTGENCGINIDECEPSPCLDGSTCVDGIGMFTCTCPPGKTGKLCETALDWNYMLRFTESSIYNYSTLIIEQDLTTLTLAFWMRTSNEGSQGTPFSYMVPPRFENAFTLTDNTGFVLYVNNHQINTDIVVTDGKWHHIAVIWSSNRGEWKVYFDALPYDDGYDLAAGETIPGGGTFVVGQEQDLDGFSSSEAFVGDLTQLHLWSRELTFNEIQNLFISCKANGDVISWRDVQSGNQGELVPEPANFCRGCPIPTNPQFGEATYESTSPGSEVIYTCAPGFNIVGRSQRVCLATSLWEGDENQECLRRDCGAPATVEYGYLKNKSSFKYDDIVVFACYRGYEMKGNDRLICNADGDWEGEKPVCDEITCELPPLSGNTRASVDKTIFRPRESVEFSCTPGNKLYTDHNLVTCQADGTFDKSVPTCDPQTCKNIPVIEHGTIEASNLLKTEYNIGEFVRYRCESGHTLTEDSLASKGQITCLPTGEWSTPLPVCKPIRCTEPSNIEHGSYIEEYPLSEPRGFLSNVIYSCDPGYNLDGQSILTCEEGGWNPMSLPSCVPISCDALENIENGVTQASSETFQSVALFSCNNGYILVGSNTTRCTETGSWSSPLPVCEPVSCGRPSSVAHGRFTASAFTFGSSTQYTCDTGYINLGADSKICQADGTWSIQDATCERVQCEMPPIVTNSQPLTGLYYYGDILVYKCLIGYRIEGNRELECLADGSYSTAPPTCDRVACPLLEDIPNGKTTMDGNYFRNRVVYSCNDGYEMNGETTRVCQPDGSWSNNPPSCIPKKCSYPDSIENGSVDFSDTIIDSVATYSCNEGYQLEGDSTRRCQTDLTWSGVLPSCVFVSCGRPPEITNGILIPSNFTYLSTAQYECQEGYTLTGEALVCSSSGEWSGDLPTCSVVLCESPSSVTSNGRMFGSNYSYGATIHYECDVGYELVGNPNRTCLANGEWDEPIPICEIVNCPSPILRNGMPSTFKTEYDTAVTFSCRPSYVLFGSSERVCLPNGSWSGANPKCVKCNEPPSVDSTSVTVDGNTVTYICNNGLVIKGQSVLKCQEDGSWTPDPPYCLCPLPENIIENGYTVVNEEMGGTIQYFCYPGYKLFGDAVRNCLKNGTWSDKQPTCITVFCPFHPPLLNGRSNTFSFTANTSLEFECNDGYRLVGSRKRVCQSNSTWSGEAPQCIIDTCGDLFEFTNGSITSNGSHIGAVAEYVCNIGFHLTGEEKRICEPDGQWRPAPPFCSVVFCPGSFTLTNGVIEGTGSYGSVLTFICNEGYEMRGNGTMTCGADGNWIGTPPTCEAIQCGPDLISAFEKGTVTIDSNTFGSAAVYSCDEGYILRGEVQRTCQSSGFWSGTQPTCEIIHCPESVPFINGRIVGEFSSTFGSILNFECFRGFNLNGPSEVRCESTGEWSGVFPTCDVIDCGPLPLGVLYNGEVEYEDSTFDSTATYSCDNGYILMGDKTRVCSLDGFWSGTQPFCTKVTCPNINIENGRTIGLSTDFESEISFECEEGYQLIGRDKLVCESSGEWIGMPPNCTAISCGEPPTITDGTVSFTDVTFRSVATYSCNLRGFRMESSPIITCLASGKWSGDAPTCTQITCPTPELVPNAEIDIRKDVYNVGDRIRYVCSEGFYLRAETPARLCLATENWSGETPECIKVKCRNPRPPRNGYIVDNGLSEYSYGDEVTIACNEGYQISSDSNTRTCGANRRWSSPPVCSQITCGNIPSRANADIVPLNGTNEYGSLINITCMEGFVNIVGTGNSVLSSCQKDGKWSRFYIECSRVLCENTPVIPNAKLSVDFNLFYGETAEVTCFEGYTLIGDDTIGCSMEGSWDMNALPVCEAINCNSPPPINNGKVSFISLKFGTEVQYSCDPGYRLVGNQLLTCQSNGKWDSLGPNCVKIVCPDAPPILNGQVVTSSVEVLPGDAVSYTCDLGYVASGSNYYHCSETGTWEGTIPVCELVSCNEPPQIYSGEVSHTTETYGSTASYSCLPGFELHGNEILSCESDGNWGKKTPTCEAISCPDPPLVIHSVTLGDLKTFGNTITYFCVEGYSLLGHDSLQCLASGRWSHMPPSCVPVSCGPPPLVENSIHLGENYVFESDVQYECERGYYLKGDNNVLKCNANGEWSGDVIRCDPVDCGPPPVLPFSTTIVYSTTFGSRISHNCNPGYRLSGNPLVMCSETGDWEQDSSLACLPLDCGAPPAVEHATLTVLNTVFRSIVNYTCDSGYQLLNSFSLQCGSNGRWQGQIPVCVSRGCERPDLPPHTQIQSASYTVGGAIHFYCEIGFTLEGLKTLNCQEDGQWDGEVPECQAVSCGPLPSFATPALEDFIPKATYNYNDVVVLRCPEGHVMTKSSSLTCSSSGNWIGEPPICVAEIREACPLKNDIPNGIAIPPAQFIGQTFPARCQAGFEAVGNMEITCTETDGWTSPEGICRRVFCGKPQITDIVNVVAVYGRSYHYGDKISYRCRPGIRPVKIPPVITCLDSGHWDSDIACSMPCKGGCRNGGVCMGIRGCKCPHGYGGLRCEKAHCIFPCLNGGTCVSPYRCTCPPGYVGVRCQTALCDPPCQNGGYCYKANTCQCPYGLKGPFCT